MNLRSSISFLLAGSALIANAQFTSGLKPIPDSLTKGFDSISPEDGRKNLTILAGADFEGRGTGQPGFQKAMDFMAMNFKKFGLKSIMPDGSYFQLVDFWRVGVDPASIKLSSSKYSAKPTEIGVARNGTVDISSGDVVFVTANGTVAKLPDEVKAAVAGKVVLVNNTSTLRNLVNLLMGADAKTVISIVDKVGAPSWNSSQREPTPSSTIARMTINRGALNRMFGPGDLAMIKAPVEANGIAFLPLSEKLTIAAKPIVEKIKVGNVVAKLEGSDPTLKDEFIGVGAHLDHLGKRGDVWYPGADDDGSGTTALLMLAKAFTANPVKPKRTVIFMSFYGEEMGLLGSGYFANNPPIDLTKMVAELQMDMVGRNSVGAQNGDQNRIDKEEENRDTIRLVGSKKISTALDKIILAENESIGWKFKYDSEDVYTRSDHYNFARKGIPIAFFFTGFHPDYHQVTDTVEKINFDKIANTAKLVYLTIHELGDYKGFLPHDVPQGKGQ